MNPQIAKLSLGFNFILILLLVYLLVDLEESENDTTAADFNPVTTESQVRRFLEEYHSAINKEGLMGEFPYLDTTEQFFWVPPGYSSWISFDSVKTVLEMTDPTIIEIKLTWEVLRIDVLSPDLAVFTGRINNYIRDTTNAESDFKLLETGVVQKKDGKWKIVSGQSRVM